MSQNLLFACFSDANDFLKEIRIGKIQRKTNSDLYMWDSESASLSEEQQSLVDEMGGSKFVWTDLDVGLTWLFQGYIRDISQSNALRPGGYDDWRVPTLRELKTLSANTKNSFGQYAKESLGNRLSGNYESCTPCVNIRGGAPRAWWNFGEGRSTTEQYSDGKIKWGSEGEYAGFDESTTHNYARLIHVRGTETHTLSDWAENLLNWAESNDELNFPVTQKNITELENLKLWFARTLPPEISRLSQLKHLMCCSHTGIEDALFSITSLETLELTKPSTKSHLEEIPSSVGNLINLVSLKASLLGLKNVHEAIGSLEALQSLDLGLNKLEQIPDSIGNLAELRSLQLWGNCITVVPNSIGRLRKLEKLSIEGCFDQLPESFRDLAGLHEIVIRSTQLADIPQYLCNLVELHSLICKAPIKILSSRLSMLKNLKTLEIQEALLESLPMDVFTMSWLKTLRVVKTPLKLIPDEISGMTNLEYLDLRGTHITSLPRSMLLLKNLRYLNVSLTQIDSLPEWLSDMKSLSKIAGNGVKFPDVLREKKAYDPR